MYDLVVWNLFSIITWSTLEDETFHGYSRVQWATLSQNPVNHHILPTFILLRNLRFSIIFLKYIFHLGYYVEVQLLNLDQELNALVRCRAFLDLMSKKIDFWLFYFQLIGKNIDKKDNFSMITRILKLIFENINLNISIFAPYVTL